jgi:RNA polymerase subunit RPABC4/transcription elongation factor Spt4
MNIIKVAKKAKEIVARPPVTCPVCGDTWFSPFDKLYVTTMDKCTMCSTDAEIEKISKFIFDMEII